MVWLKNLILKLNKQKQVKEESPAVSAIRKRLKLQALTMLASVALVLVLVFEMTAAWYTNVAKTSDLTFKAQSWGFDADRITVSETPISVMPGTSGIVPLTVDNSERTEAVEIGVTISKRAGSAAGAGESAVISEEEAAALRELQKRIFFYADTGYTYSFGDSAAAAAETVSRVYLGATEAENYIYRILPGQKLILSDTYYNDVPIKWMWVYDMLGYYFRGTVTADASPAVDEYLRPIEYDYAEAVFDETEDSPYYGQLAMTGELTREAFLQEISGADGYEGAIDMSKAVPLRSAEGPMYDWYYPVDVDENGFGVWAYLCSRQEIEAGISYDNQLSQQENGVSMTVTISLTAVSLPMNVEEIESAAAFEAALTDNKIDTVSLQNDIYLSEPLAMTGDTAKVVNLNGYTLEYDGTENFDDMFTVRDGASLTVMGGSLNYTAGGDKTKVSAVASLGADVTLSNVNVIGFDTAVDIEDSKLNAEDGGNADGSQEPAAAKDSTVRIAGCTFDTKASAIVIRGNGDASETATKVLIEDSKITSQYVAIVGQGAPDNWGTELVIMNSTVEGQYAALYQPQKRAVTTIADSELRGITGMSVKGGVVKIIDSTIQGTGPYGEAANAASGFTDTGDGISVEAGYDWSASVILEGENTITSQNAYAVNLFGVESKGPGKVLIRGGTFTGGKGSAKWNGIGIFEIYGGTFTGELAAPQETPIVRYDLPKEEETQ